MAGIEREHPTRRKGCQGTAETTSGSVPPPPHAGRVAMPRRTVMAGGIGLLFAGTPLAAQVAAPSARLADVLPTLMTAHPRLLVTDDAMAECRKRAAGDPVYAKMIERIVAEARKILTEPTVPYRLTGTSRLSMLGGARQMIRRVINTAFAWRWTGERVFADRVRTEILNAARYPDWNHTHFLDTAEIAFAVALGYDWIHAALSPAERATIRMALVEKGLLWADRAYRGTTDEWLQYPTFWWNWNQVCNAGMLAAALVVAEDEPLLAADILAGVDRSLPLATAALAPDGAGPEGPIYWTYGITFHVLALAMLQAATGNDHGSGDTAAFRQTDLYRLWAQGPTDKAFNYGDCKELLSPTSATAWLGLRHDHPQVVALARREMIARFDRPLLDGEFDRFYALYSIWYPAATKAPPLREKARRFRGNADLAVFRGDWSDPGAAYLGFKAGDNATNHAHLDLGSFVLEGQGVRWAIDLGGDSYQLPGYFDSKNSSGGRYRIFRVSTAGHGTFMPLGIEQDPFRKAPITTFAARPDGGLAIADLTDAYPGTAKRIRRGVAFIDRGARVMVRDEVEGAKPGSVWRSAIFTRASIAIDGRRATLTQDGRTMIAIIETPNLTFASRPATPPTTAENQNEGVSILSVEAAANGTGLAAVQIALYPLGDAPKLEGEVPLDRW